MAVSRPVALVLNLYGDSLARLNSASELKDPKTRLQEYLQARQLGLLLGLQRAGDSRRAARAELHG